MLQVSEIQLYWILVDNNIVEQVMIEQLAEHGVQTSDLTPALMQSARVKNPMADVEVDTEEHKDDTSSNHSAYATPEESNSPVTESPVELHKVQSPTQLPPSKNIDIDLRWTVLCDLFLVLIADSIYDSRSRKLLELVAQGLDVKWLDICRFEKRVTDAREMQEEATKENWNEAQHMEDRRKKALKRKYMYMGIATVGGSLIIGLSAGLLRQAVYTTARLGFFDTFMKALTTRAETKERKVTFYERAGAGLTAGGLAAMVGNPADLALIRMQSDGLKPKAERARRFAAFTSSHGSLIHHEIVSRNGLAMD